MIYTFTLNPSLDYIMEVDDLKIGEINRSKSEILRVGGKGINVSMVLRELGTKSVACGLMAGVVGDVIIDELKKVNIKSCFIKVKGNSRINVKLTGKYETAINGRGCIAEKEDIDRLCCLVKSSSEDYIVLSGSVCGGLDNKVYAYIMERLQGRFIVDSSKDLLTNTLKYRPFLIKPNHIELGEIFGCDIGSFEEAVYYGEKLCDMGAENVIVSMGKMGAVFVNNNYEYIVKSGGVKVKNTVGAGDTMVAGFLHKFINGCKFEESLRFASELAEKLIGAIY